MAIDVGAHRFRHLGIIPFKAHLFGTAEHIFAWLTRFGSDMHHGESADSLASGAMEVDGLGKRPNFPPKRGDPSGVERRP